ncbi:hypothetical protein RvY_02726 [Ramazzottius varieornatus]|uniref:Uncharacterized protein n=1 Tax=Ramazzottius varieornatus TaxID=947166 RepID=A0A1D1UVW4_RAMVA|nr:hypothetical protein RvY_02726 [Ramazzottius varieornatus]
MKRRERVNITPVMPVILPRPESATTSSSASLGPYFTDIEGNIHFAGSSKTMDESIPTHVTVEASAKSSQKIILPKLPAGVKPPSKIIVINNSNRDAGPPKVHVINTSKAGSQAYDEESRKRRVMTGELHMPKNILPKPEPLMLKKKPVVFARPGGTVSVPKIAIAKLPVSGNMQQKRGYIHNVVEETASDGFEIYSEDNLGSTFAFNLQMQPLSISDFEGNPVTLPRAIRPKPPPRIQLADGSVLPAIYPKEPAHALSVFPDDVRRMFSLVPSQPPDPDDFRPPKRRRGKKGSKAEKALVPKGRTGRPTRLRKSAAQLLEELNSDSLALSSDGVNVKCRPCNVLLTKDGTGYSRQLMRHLQQIKSHRSNYEQWKFRQEVHAEPSFSSSEESLTRNPLTPEGPRSRGRHRRTPLSFVTEFNSPWLEITGDGETLFCKACDLVLVGGGHNMRRSEIYRHLSRDESHHQKVGLYEILHGTVEGVSVTEQNTVDLMDEVMKMAPDGAGDDHEAFLQAEVSHDSEMEEPATEETEEEDDE